MTLTRRSLPLAAALAALVLTPLTAWGASSRADTGATITAAQYAQRADRIFARNGHQQAAPGPGLINADLVTKAHLARAGAYLDKIVAITNTEARSLAALPRTENGMPQRRAFLAALRTVLTDERAAADAAHNGNLAGFRTAFDRFILHGRPTGPDYRTLLHALRATTRSFPLDHSGKSQAIYP
jgi:hypothetical protein